MIAEELFETRTMIQAIDEMEVFRPKTFLTNMFFVTGEDIEGEVLEIDIIKGTRKLAPWVHPKSKAKKIDRRPFETNQIKPGYIQMQDEANAADMFTRRPGETIYRPGISAGQLAAERLGEQLADFIDMIIRRIETMAAEALRTGKVTMKGEGIDAEVDFQRDASLDIILAGTDLWDDSSSDPTDHILEWQDLIADLSGEPGNIIVLGFLALRHFLQNSKVQNFLDKLRMDLGSVHRQERPDNTVHYGEIHGTDIWYYNERYVDDDGTKKRMIGDKEIIMGVKGQRSNNRLHYGAIRDVEAGVVATPFFPKSWIEPSPSARILEVKSAPVVALHRPDTTLRATVLN